MPFFSRTTEALSLNNGALLLVTRRPNESADEALARELREIGPQFAKNYRTKPFRRRQAFVRRVPTRDALLEGVTLANGRYRVPEESPLGRLWCTHLRWYDAVRSSSFSDVELNFVTNRRQCSHSIECSLVEAILDYYG